MKRYYQVMVSYPDGHIEELEEKYALLEEAKEYGFHLLKQIMPNERFHKSGSSLDDDEFPKKLQKPYFLVTLKEEKDRTIVFDSRHDK